MIRVLTILSVVLLLAGLSCSDYNRPRQEVCLAAVGDVMLGRYIGKVMNTRGERYPFEQVRILLSTYDIVFGNLESGIAKNTSAPFFPKKPYNFAASPLAATTLKEAGFTVLSLANNHMLDYGPDELTLTRSLLQKQGLSPFGAGKDISEARQPTVLTRNGVRFGFLGYGVAHSRAVYAQRSRAGIAPIIIDDIRKDILALRSQVDVLIVSLHWGIEYEKTPSRIQREEAHRIIDWGADLILGHHPHVMQGLEIYKRKIIAYSLGNFIFDQKGNGTDRSFILACRFREKTLHSVEIIPLDRVRSYFPNIADGKSKESILQDLRNISLPLNSNPHELARIGLTLKTSVMR